MKLKIRTLNNTEVEVDAPHEALVSEVKLKVEALLPHLESDRQILIHQGKILNNSMKLSEYPNIKDGDKVVVMLPKVINLYSLLVFLFIFIS